LSQHAVAFSFSAVFVSSSGAASMTRSQHLLRLTLRGAKCERRDARGLETHPGPHTGLLMTSDVAHARQLSPDSGEGPRLRVNAMMHREESRCPIKRSRCRTCGS
jgi:hypothetical protein